MRKKTGLAIILVALTLSLTTAALIPQNQTPSWILTQTTPLKQPTPKNINITWGNETRANNWTSDGQRYPSVCYFPDGSFVVAWHGKGGYSSGDDVLARLFNSSGNNETAGDILVNNETTDTQMNPSVCCFPDGSKFVVAWQCARNHVDYDIYVRVFNATTGENLTGDIQVNTNATYDQTYPSVCCFPDGSGFVVVWQSENQTGDETWDVCAKIFYPNGTSKTSDIRVNNITTNNQDYHSVCCLSDRFVVVWESNQDGIYDDIYFKLFDYSGDILKNDTLVNTYTVGNQRWPSVCCFPDSSGFVVAWHGRGQGDPDEGVYTKVFYSNGINQTSDILVNGYTSSEQWYPSVCCRSDGSFVVAWQSLGQDGSDPDSRGVFAKFFHSSGGNQTGDIQVNTNTTYDQTKPSVCCFPDDSGFVVAWQSYNQTGDETWDVNFRIGDFPLSPPGGAALLSLLLALLAAQSGAGVSVPLLVGGVLAVAVVVGVIAYWLRKR